MNNDRFTAYTRAIHDAIRGQMPKEGQIVCVEEVLVEALAVLTAQYVVAIERGGNDDIAEETRTHFETALRLARKVAARQGLRPVDE